MKEDKKVIRKQIRERVNALLERNLHLLTDEEWPPLSLKNGVQDTRFYIDHLRIDDKGAITQHPYGASMRAMKALIEWCEEHGYDFYIMGARNTILLRPSR